MSDMNMEFYNKYVQVLKGRYDSLQGDLINMEAQLILVKEALAEKTQEAEDMAAEIEKLSKGKSKKVTGTDDSF